MISPDDEGALRAGDPSGLLDAYLSLPDQLEEGYRLGGEVDLAPAGTTTVYLCGMGGSAAASDVGATVAVHALVETPPVIALRDERVPVQRGPGVLVVCVSYSGETREALEAAQSALGNRNRLVTIASGGRLVRSSREGGIPVMLPGSAPAPRAALGWMAGAVGGVLSRGLASAAGQDVAGAMAAEVSDALPALRRVAPSLAPGHPSGSNRAKEIGAWLGDRAPVIWSATPAAFPAAWRWKAAFNENAKIPAFASSLPELAHHEIAGWTKEWSERFAVIVLRGVGEEGDLVGRRVAAATEILEDAGLPWRQVRMEPSSIVGDLLGLMLIGDMASAYHALARGVDPAPIEAIDRLKDRLR